MDACTLKNFSVVGRMDVLEKHFTGRARWTEAIQREAGRLGLPPLDWLGPAMSPGDDIEALIGVDEIRRGLGATRADPATLHLGEAEAIYALERYHQDWTFVSDDQPAVDFARRRGLTAIDSEAVLADCYESGLVRCPEAFDLLKSMADAGRGVRVPPSHWFVCPPTPRPETRMHLSLSSAPYLVRVAAGQQPRCTGSLVVPVRLFAPKVMAWAVAAAGTDGA